jgi:hypothetical protein
VVETATVKVVTVWELAGQLVISAAQLMMVETIVEYTVEVLNLEIEALVVGETSVDEAETSGAVEVSTTEVLSTIPVEA